jgi:hypothetical protein
MMKKSWILILLAGLLLASATMLAGQQEAAPASQEPSTPGSAQSTGPSNAAPQGAAVTQQAPLSGAYVPTPQLGTKAPSYFLPSLEWTMSGNTNPSSVTTGASASVQNTIVGNITLQRTKRNSQLNLNYKGGAVFYSGGQSSTSSALKPSNDTYHSLEVTQSFNWRRWDLEMSDQFSYFPESSFGFSGFGGLSSFGSGLGGSYLASSPAINPAYEPSQAILTRRSRRLGNVALGQVDYELGQRSTLTVSGGYGNLHFLDPGFLDSDYWKISSGYNYQLSRTDTLAGTYTRTEFHFGSSDRSIVNHDLSAAYGHQITGRLTLQISGGPLISQSTVAGNTQTRYLLNTFDSLRYRVAKGYFEGAFERFGTNGSGVLTGAETNLTRFSAGHRISAKTFGSFEVSYATNEAIARQPSGTSPKFKTWGTNLNISRQFTQRVSVYFAYYLQHQTSDQPVCFNGACGESLNRNVFGIGVNWHGRPIRLD